MESMELPFIAVDGTRQRVHRYRNDEIRAGIRAQIERACSYVTAIVVTLGETRNILSALRVTVRRFMTRTKRAGNVCYAIAKKPNLQTRSLYRRTTFKRQ